MRRVSAMCAGRNDSSFGFWAKAIERRLALNPVLLQRRSSGLRLSSPLSRTESSRLRLPIRSALGGSGAPLNDNLVNGIGSFISDVDVPAVPLYAPGEPDAPIQRSAPQLFPVMRQLGKYEFAVVVPAVQVEVACVVVAREKAELDGGARIRNGWTLRSPIDRKIAGCACSLKIVTARSPLLGSTEYPSGS